jgi:hypothetical protein
MGSVSRHHSKWLVARTMIQHRLNCLLYAILRGLSPFDKPIGHFGPSGTLGWVLRSHHDAENVPT